VETAERIEAIDFYSPIPVGLYLIKAVRENDDYIIYLEASNENKDQEGETALQKALMEQKDYFLAHGVVSWDHQHKEQHDPNFIVGEPLSVAFHNDGRTLIKARLYPYVDKAMAIWKLAQSDSTRLGASVGGMILKKAHGRISKVIWDEIAITHKPVNDDTLGKVKLMPYAEFAKALSAGSGVDAALFTGGRALIGESLQGNVVKMQNAYTMESLTDDIVKMIVSGQIRDYSDLIAYVLQSGYDSSVATELARLLSDQLPVEVASLRGGV